MNEDSLSWTGLTTLLSTCGQELHRWTLPPIMLPQVGRCIFKTLPILTPRLRVQTQRPQSHTLIPRRQYTRIHGNMQHRVTTGMQPLLYTMLPAPIHHVLTQVGSLLYLRQALVHTILPDGLPTNGCYGAQEHIHGTSRRANGSLPPLSTATGRQTPCQRLRRILRQTRIRHHHHRPHHGNKDWTRKKRKPDSH